MYQNYIKCKCGTMSFVDGKHILSFFGPRKKRDYCSGCKKDLSKHLMLVQPNVGTYIGSWKEDRRHGHGSYTSESGSIYVGEWQDNHPHGYGIISWLDGSLYAGEWHYGNIQGMGVFMLANKEMYVGKFNQFKYHGKGLIQYADGQVLIGKWKNNIRDNQYSTVFNTDGTIINDGS